MSPQETIPPATPGVSAVAGIECPACGTQNTTDSKFCRHCGHLLRPLPGASNEPRKAAPTEGTESEDEENLTSPAEIDARRARQLLDRALLMSERGDLNAALLACRQAIALDHDHSESYALLGTLLERNGDLRGAMTAYEHVLEISPDNQLERDSLNRIKARLDKTPAFNFNPNDLFGDDTTVLPSVAASGEEVPDALPQDDLAAIAPERDEHGIEARLPPTSGSLRTEASATPVGEVSGITAAPVVAPLAPVVFDFDPAPESALPSLSPLASAMDGETVARVGAAIPPSSKPAAPAETPPARGTGGMPKIERRVAQRRQVNVPVATERRVAVERRASASVAGATFAPTSPTRRVGSLTPIPLNPQPVAPLDFSFGTTPAAPTPLWAQMLRGSSFYGRTLPLVVVGVLGLGFLGWARSQAVAHDTDSTTGTTTTIDNSGTTTTVTQPAGQTQNNFSTGTTFATPAPNSGSGFPVTNATQAPTIGNTNTNSGTNPSANTPTRVATNPSTGAQRSGSGAGGDTSAGTPPFPVPVAPAPAASAGGTTGSNNSGSSSNTPIVLPPPQTPSTGGNAAPPIQVGSLGTNPLNPGGAPQEGRIRITQGSLNTRSAPPPRTGSMARSNERAASDAAANGNQNGAINNLTNAINSSGGDQGFLLQQRAMAFMDRGDYARAVEDFQASISAYQDQINRGDNVAAAQAGVRSARSGLNLALSRR